MVSRIHASQRKADLDTSLSSVRLLRSTTRAVCMLLRNRRDVRRRLCCNQGQSRLFHAECICRPYRNTRDGRQIQSANHPRCQVSLPDMETSRLTLIPCSTNPATPFLLDRPIYFPCSFRVPRRGRSRDGHIMRITRTSQKVRLAHCQVLVCVLNAYY